MDLRDGIVMSTSMRWAPARQASRRKESGDGCPMVAVVNLVSGKWAACSKRAA
ncbi:MAG: hypothetical protein WAU49_10560 [Steroidobacteraceae bacterium]